MGKLPAGAFLVLNQESIRNLVLETVPNIDKERLTNDVAFSSLNVDSLDLMSIIMSIQEASGIQIADEDIDTLMSINAIQAYLNSKM